jgi:uncharacterized membrane-anchored protein YjiN (DUF445 family)
MTRLEREKVILIFKYQNLLELSKRIDEGHPRRDSARNLLPYVDRLISICSKQIECEQIKDRIEKAERFFNQAYELIRTTNAIPREEVEEEDAQARASVEVLKDSLAEKQLEIEAIRIRISKEAAEIIKYLEILELKQDRLLLSGLPNAALTS